MAAQVIIRCTKGGYKFVVLENEKGEMVVFADDDERFDYHRDLLVQYRKESGLRAKCVGGGIIEFSNEKKAIHITGKSGAFDVEPDRNETVSAIKQAYPDFEVTGS